MTELRKTRKAERQRGKRLESLVVVQFETVALHNMHYNFCRIHQTLRVTPAMEAGVTDHVWDLEEIISLLDDPTRR